MEGTVGHGGLEGEPELVPEPPEGVVGGPLAVEPVPAELEVVVPVPVGVVAVVVGRVVVGRVPPGSGDVPVGPAPGAEVVAVVVVVVVEEVLGTGPPPVDGVGALVVLVLVVLAGPTVVVVVGGLVVPVGTVPVGTVPVGTVPGGTVVVVVEGREGVVVVVRPVVLVDVGDVVVVVVDEAALPGCCATLTSGWAGKEVVEVVAAAAVPEDWTAATVAVPAAARKAPTVRQQYPNERASQPRGLKRPSPRCLVVVVVVAGLAMLALHGVTDRRA